MSIQPYKPRTNALAGLLLVGAAFGPLPTGAQQRPSPLGTIKSVAPLMIDGALVSPAAAPVWPLAEGDEVAVTSAPAVFVASDGNRLTFDKATKARVKTIADGKTYVFLRSGTVAFKTTAAQLFVCAGGKLYAPPTNTTGTIRLGNLKNVNRKADSGKFSEDGLKTCDEKGPLQSLAKAAPAAGTATGGAAAGTASAAGTAATGGAVAAGGAAAGTTAGTAAGTAIGIGTAATTAVVTGGVVAAASAAAVGLASSASASSTSSGASATGVAVPCAAGGDGCNFNPPAVSSSQP